MRNLLMLIAGMPTWMILMFTISWWLVGLSVPATFMAFWFLLRMWGLYTIIRNLRRYERAVNMKTVN